MNLTLKKQLALALGIIGMLMLIFANFVPQGANRSYLFLLGGLLMLSAALIEQQKVFSASQFVISVGAGLGVLSLPLVAKFVIPLVLALFFIVYLAIKGWVKDYLTVIGLLGMSLLSLGYAVANPWLYFVGGICFIIYSAAQFFQGVSIALLWVILNTFFSIAAAINIYTQS